MLRCASPDFLIIGAFNACPEFAVERFAVFETFSQENELRRLNKACRCQIAALFRTGATTSVALTESRVDLPISATLAGKALTWQEE